MKNFNKIKEFNREFMSTENKYYEFIKTVGLFLEDSVCQLESLQDRNYFLHKSFDELEKINKTQFSIINEDNYSTSFLNPTYACNVLGEKVGAILSSYFYSIFNCLKYAYRQNAAYIDVRINQFFRLTKLLTTNNVNPIELTDLLKKFEIENLEFNELLILEEDYPTTLNIETDICLNSDFSNNSYLYKYGVPIGEIQLDFASLLSTYSQDRINKIAQHIVNSYLEGFRVRNKNHKHRNCSRIVSVIGLERITRAIVHYLNSKGIKGYVVVNYENTFNAQMDLDHKNDITLFLDESFANIKLNAIKKAHAQCSKVLSDYMGNIIMLSFGQEPPKIVFSSLNLTMNKIQQQLLKSISLKSKECFESYVPKSEISYTGIAFPCSEIQGSYEEIFDEIMKINLIDPKPYLEIQNMLIETLDKGKYAIIKGGNGNKTDLKIALQPIENPKTESNFMSCGSDVNIPIGEVYTSPKLNGTNGTLHVKEIVVSKKLYKDLLIEIKEGYVVDFSCSNFAKINQGKQYIQNNLFNGHDTLAVGEFAIGTNTYAYATAKRLGIVDKLHTLIVEKMGPHIALGDTCCAWSEENLFIDIINKKRFTAYDNEKSVMRKSDISKAYFNTHKDITIPYDDVALISIFTHDNKEIQIIKDGRFVLPGCEYLNIPLDK